MRYVSFVRLGEPAFGVFLDNKVYDLTYQLGSGVTTLKEAIHFNLLPENIDELEEYLGQLTALSLSDITFLPVIPDPGKILCIGLNYEKHRKETQRPDSAHPTIFTRFADTQVAHREAVIRPEVSERVDFEGELAVIIGKGGKNISTSDAMKSIVGYSCYNDVSIRDFQRHTSQFTPGKNFSKTGSFGPFLTMASSIVNYEDLSIKTILNGETVQEAKLDQLIFSIPDLISYTSTFTPLVPGDVIVSGTPGGVGDRRDPPLYMNNGDIVKVEISEIGTLINPILDEESII
jgi:2-keto-4-pentenoate hydratase/2-oxohepta-3-ene-1,7-dioic acid hydratase in catechol pathway